MGCRSSQCFESCSWKLIATFNLDTDIMIDMDYLDADKDNIDIDIDHRHRPYRLGCTLDKYTYPCSSPRF